MQDNITIARPYARAVFEQAQEEGNLEHWSSMMETLSSIVQDPQMRSILSSPRITDQQLLGLISEIIGDSLSKTGTNFVKILIRANRLSYVPDILQLFENARAEAEGRMDIDVISAYELESDQETRIAEAMGKRLGKKINISPVVDKSLIGGMIIRAGDSVIDASLRGRLSELHNSLIG